MQVQKKKRKVYRQHTENYSSESVVNSYTQFTFYRNQISRRVAHTELFNIFSIKDAGKWMNKIQKSNKSMVSELENEKKNERRECELERKEKTRTKKNQKMHRGDDAVQLKWKGKDKKPQHTVSGIRFYRVKIYEKKTFLNLNAVKY